MNKIQKVFATLTNLKKRTDSDAVYAVAGHSTLFIIISFFPLIMLLLALVKYLPISEQYVIDTIKSVPLGAMNEPIDTAVGEIYSRSGSFVLSVTAIGLLWSASTSVYSLVLGLNKVYNHKETRNYFVVRGLSILYTLVLISSITVALGLMVFGKSILEIFKISSVALDALRIFGSFLILFVLFDFLYTTIPNRPSKLIFEMPGALFSATGWFLFSYIYSLYIRNYSNVSYVYGSLAAVVFLMIWLYTCMYIFFIGAEINQMVLEAGWCKEKREKFLAKKSNKGKKFMKKEYFLFDLDGTLANSCEGVTNCIKYALVKMNRPIPSDEVLNMFLGPALSYSFKTFCNMDEETAEKAVAYYRERYTDKGVYENTIYDGVEDTLRELKNKGKKVILATAKPEPFARTILAYYKLDKYFDEIVGATFDASIIGTKDEVIKEVFKRCDIKDKAQVLMIGDRDHDVLGAKENGIECAGVTYGFAQKGELETAGADYIIDSMDEILKFC